MNDDARDWAATALKAAVLLGEERAAFLNANDDELSLVALMQGRATIPAPLTEYREDLVDSLKFRVAYSKMIADEKALELRERLAVFERRRAALFERPQFTVGHLWQMVHTLGEIDEMKITLGRKGKPTRH